MPGQRDLQSACVLPLICLLLHPDRLTARQQSLDSWQSQLNKRQEEADELEQRATAMLASAREAATAAVTQREEAERQLHEAQLQLQRLEAELDSKRIVMQVGLCWCASLMVGQCPYHECVHAG
jgi:hypothetical protein